MKKIQIAIMAAIVAGAMSASASLSLFDITYVGNGFSGSGQVAGISDGGGAYTIVSGTFQIASGPDATPVMTLATAPSQQTFSANGSPLGGPTYLMVMNGGADLFPYDDLLFPGQNPSLDLSTGGLAFTSPTGQNSVYGIVMWSDGPNDYGDFLAEPVNTFNEFSSGGTFSASLVAVPEASTMIAGALLLLPFGASALRILRRNRMA
jgi:hypothetical protein